MFVVCRGCKRRLEWSAKQDRGLRELACPHCSATYYKPTGYTDVHDPADVVRRAENVAQRIELAAARVEGAIREAAKLPQLLIEAQEQLADLHAPRLRLLVSRRGEGGAA